MLMKRIVLPAVLVALIFIWVCAANAGAETVKITCADRVNLRSSPNGTILARFYENTPAELLETKGRWSRIRIGEDPVSVTGWMMNEFLAPVEADEWLYIGQDCITSQGHPVVPLLNGRKKNALVVDVWDGTDPDAVLTVAGIFSGNEWLMVARTRGSDDPEWFFASADFLSRFDSMYVLSRDEASVVSFRAAPGTSAKILGSYFGGVQGNILFDFEQTEGWTRLCIGGVSGYMMNTFLAEVAFDVPPSRPPLSPLARPTVSVYANAVGNDPLIGRELLTDQDLFSILGRGKTRVHIRMETEEPGEYDYGWIDQKDLERQDLTGSFPGTPRFSAGTMKSAVLSKPAGKSRFAGFMMISRRMIRPYPWNTAIRNPPAGFGSKRNLQPEKKTGSAALFLLKRSGSMKI